MKKINISLRFKIVFILATLLTLTTIGASWLSSQPFSEENQNLVVELNSHYAAKTVANLEDSFEISVHQLANLGRELYLRSKLDTNSNFLYASILRTAESGTYEHEKSLSVPGFSAPGDSWLGSMHSYLTLAANGAPQFFSVPLPSGHFGIGLAIPLLEENQELRGRVLVGILNSSPILDLLGEDDVGSRFLVNSRGSLLLHSGGLNAPVGSDLSSRESVKAYLERKFSNGQSRGVRQSDHVAILSNFQTIGKLEIALISEVPEAQLFLAADRVQFRALLVAVILLCLAFFIGSFLSESITEPISELVAATELVKQGQYEIKIKSTRKDEIGILSNSFVQMASEIKVQQDALINQEKLVVAGRLARNIGHEFGNILQPLLIKLELLQEVVRDDGHDDQANKLQEMIEIATMGAGICKGLLTLSKETSETAVHSAFKLADSVQKAMRLLSHELKKKDIHTELSVDPDITVMGSESQIIQVIVNMSVNAMHAMNDGGRLTFKTIQNNDCLELEITDNGSGISPENLQKIFEPLFSTKGVKGNGLGLSISMAILEAHHGSIKVRSAAGVGTTMTLVFPVVAQKLSAAS